MKRIIEMLKKFAEGFSFLGKAEKKDQVTYVIDEWAMEDPEYFDKLKGILEKPSMKSILEADHIEFPSSEDGMRH